MKSFDTIKLAAALLSSALFTTPAYAWDHAGHQAVAYIAEQQITPEAKEKISALLALEGDKNLASIANWADAQRKLHPGEGGPSHSVRLPLDRPDFTPDACPSKFCATAAIERYEKILQDKSKSPADRLVALKYVVHLVGDVHQPLHATARTGAGQPVVFNGEPTTLHKVWDSAFAPKGVTGKSLARAAMDQAGPQRGGGTPEQWAMESRDIALRRIFSDFPRPIKAGVQLPADYGERQWPIAAQRLVQAGTRLAEELNRLLG